MKCQDCKYFVMPANERMGSCKRFPAAVNKIFNDWCGEFFRKEVIEDAPVKVEIEFKSVFPIETTPEQEVALFGQEVVLEEKPKRKPRAKKDAS